MKRVEVDFGTTVRGGLIRASLRRFPDQTVVRGEAVEAFDDDEGISFTGVVEEVDDRFAYLRMHWSDRPDVPSCSLVSICFSMPTPLLSLSPRRARRMSQVRCIG